MKYLINRKTKQKPKEKWVFLYALIQCLKVCDSGACGARYAMFRGPLVECN